MTMTEQVLMETYRQAHGDVHTVVETAVIGAALALDRDEMSSIFRALELTGLIAFTAATSTTSVQMTAEGVARCRQHGGASKP